MARSRSLGELDDSRFSVEDEGDDVGFSSQHEDIANHSFGRLVSRNEGFSAFGGDGGYL